MTDKSADKAQHEQRFSSAPWRPQAATAAQRDPSKGAAAKRPLVHSTSTGRTPFPCPFPLCPFPFLLSHYPFPSAGGWDEVDRIPSQVSSPWILLSGWGTQSSLSSEGASDGAWEGQV